MNDVAAGLDVGYGNLKIVWGHSAQQFTTSVMPVGAAPLDRLAKDMNGAANLGSGYEVQVNNVPWVAGVAPTLLQGATRVLHADYSKSPEYQALYYAALLRTGAERIGLLVTGLPVSQHIGEQTIRTELRDRLRGRHFINATRTVVVDEVEVLPQPIGAYFDACYSHGQRLTETGDSYTLVFDPGFFSVDWVVIYRNRLRDSSSDSSKIATSQILASAAREIGRENGSSEFNVAKLEEAMRAGRDTISMYGQQVPIMPAVERAAREASGRVVNDLLNKMRTAGHDIDRIVLAGGGASLYEGALREAFPKAEMIKPAEPVLANARGFFLAGRREMQRKRAADQHPSPAAGVA